jgi:hypothetical protein
MRFKNRQPPSPKSCFTATFFTAPPLRAAFSLILPEKEASCQCRAVIKIFNHLLMQGALQCILECSCHTFGMRILEVSAIGLAVPIMLERKAIGLIAIAAFDS